MAISIRETFYEIMSSNEAKERKKEDFVRNAKKFLETANEIKLPMQMFENIFEFDFHREAPHPISTYLVRQLKKQGLRVTKVRNSYLVRIRKYEKKSKKRK